MNAVDLDNVKEAFLADTVFLTKVVMAGKRSVKVTLNHLLVDAILVQEPVICCLELEVFALTEELPQHSPKHRWNSNLDVFGEELGVLLRNLVKIVDNHAPKL